MYTKRSGLLRYILVFALVITQLLRESSATTVQGAPSTLRVPQDYATIQAAVNASLTGDVVLVSPGTYYETVILSGKTITLASLYYTTRDAQYIESTVIDGQLSPGVIVNAGVGPETTITGFTIRNCNDGVKAFAKLNILYNHFIANDDGIDYTDSGGILRGNIFENSTDDGIDLDMATEALIENNISRNNHEDGIEIRFQDYTGPMLNTVIRDNQLYGNGQNGIQLISYNVVTNRTITIEHNLIKNNGRVGVGLMDNADSSEDYRAASIPERIHILNNTFDGNKYALTGGDNLVAVNNIFANSTIQGIKNVDGSSIVAYSNFWNNISHQTGSNVDTASTIYGNPLLDANNNLSYGSPAIDAGTPHFDWQGTTVLDYSPGSYYGTAPDLGWHESNYLEQPTPTPTQTPSATFTALPGNTITLNPSADATILSAAPNNNYGSTTQLTVDSSPLSNYLIKFSVSGISGRTVTKARLRLYNINASIKSGDFHIADNNWIENTVNWNNAPAANAEIIAPSRTVSANAWFEIDLTSLITGDGEFTLRVTSTSSDGAEYSSRETANPPQLIIDVIGLSSATATALPPTSTPTPLPPTSTHTALPTNTATPAYSPTPSGTRLPSNTPAETFTPTYTPLATETALPTNTPFPSNTSTSSFTPTNPPLFTATPLTTTLFTDGFEAGNFASWTSVTIGGDGNATVQSLTYKTGSYAARLSASSTTQSRAYARKNLPAAEKNITISGWFMIAQEGASSGNVPIFRLYDPAGKRLLTLYRQNLSGNRVYVTDGSARLLASQTMPLSTWVKFDLHVITAGSGASTIELFMNGTIAAQSSTVNLGTAGVYTIQIGNDTTKQIFTLFADDISVTK